MQAGKKWARSGVTHLKFSFVLPPRDTSGQPAGTAPARRLRKHADTVGDTERLPAWNASTSSRDSRTPFMTAWMAVTSLRTKRASGESRPCTANRLASFAGGMSCGISLRASATTSPAFPLSSVGRIPERVRLVRRLVAKEVRRDCWPTGTVPVKRWWGCHSNEKQIARRVGRRDNANRQHGCTHADTHISSHGHHHHRNRDCEGNHIVLPHDACCRAMPYPLADWFWVAVPCGRCAMVQALVTAPRSCRRTCPCDPQAAGAKS